MCDVGWFNFGKSVLLVKVFPKHPVTFVLWIDREVRAVSNVSDYGRIIACFPSRWGWGSSYLAVRLRSGTPYNLLTDWTILRKDGAADSLTSFLTKSGLFSNFHDEWFLFTPSIGFGSSTVDVLQTTVALEVSEKIWHRRCYGGAEFQHNFPSVDECSISTNVIEGHLCYRSEHLSLLIRFKSAFSGLPITFHRPVKEWWYGSAKRQHSCWMCHMPTCDLI